jgi:hypothetical protein
VVNRFSVDEMMASVEQKFSHQMKLVGVDFVNDVCNFLRIHTHYKKS